MSLPKTAHPYVKAPMETTWKESQSENVKERLNYVQSTQRGYEYTPKVQKQRSEQQKSFQSTKIEPNRDIGLLQKIQIEMEKKKKGKNKPTKQT